jgi:hypothetical protein
LPLTVAQQAYAGAVSLAPDLPAVYYSWGVARARHGDLAGVGEALGKYDQALRHAPSWKQLQEVREALAKRKS